MKLSKTQLNQLTKLLRYSNRYEISIQFWPSQTTVYIEKDGIDLMSYGGEFDFAINSSNDYLNRINKSKS